MAKRFQNPWTKGGQFGHILDKVLDTSQVLGKAPSSVIEPKYDSSEIPDLPPIVIAAMQAAINDSYVKGRGGDPHGGFHEEGGIWAVNSQNPEDIIIYRAEPGKYVIPLGNNAAQVFFFIPETDQKYIRGFFHTHPSGYIADFGGQQPRIFDSGRRNPNPKARTDAKQITGVGLFLDQPSPQDIKTAKLYDTSRHFVLGTRSKTIYEYNGSGIVYQKPFSFWGLKRSSDD
jgi:hypothetical protein